MQLLLTYVIGQCPDCGESVIFGVNDSGIEDSAGNPVCIDCAAEWEECGRCHEWHHSRDMKCVGDYGWVCDTCYRESGEFVRCHDCGKVIHIDDAEHLGEEYFCSECVNDWFVCDECGDLCRFNDGQVTTHCDGNICEYCYDRHYATCEDCGEVFRTDDMYWRESQNAYYCENCDPGEEEESDSYGIYSYHGFRRINYCVHYDSGEAPDCKVPPHKRPRTYGVELECDDGHFDISDFEEYDDRIHFEHDGSLTRLGVECISQPCSLRYHQNRMEWDDICAKLLTQGFRSHNTTCCGLHVHIGRNQISPVTITKLDVFINQAKSFFIQIARRSVFYRTEYDTGRRLSKLKAEQPGFGNRYTAVNTNNRDTVEIRIFKGTLKVDTILGTLEMLDALIRFLEYVSVAHIYDIDENVLRFVDFCGEHADEYPHLMPMFARLVKEGPCMPNVASWMKKIENRNKRKELKKCA